MFVLESIKKYAMSDRIALVNREETLSFAELDARSDAFAMYLLESLGEDRTEIVIYGHKETDILPCMYGALKAGRGYVPIDITVPVDRVQQIVDDVQPKVIVDFYGIGLRSDGVILSAETLRDRISCFLGCEVPKENWIKGETPAYILFTSGSTGKPKGVPITAANIENLYSGLLPWMTGEGVILNQISYSFDVSVCSVYVGMAQGMTLYTIDKQMIENLGELFEYLERSGLETWVSTPSFAEICVQSAKFNSGLMPKLKRFLFCGEVLTHKLCDQLAERFPEAKVINTYGPTEATVLVTAVEITEKLRHDELQIPIGYPLDEVTFRIVDGEGRDVSPGEQGELLIISKNVGPGYYKRPDLTEKVFFKDRETGKRGYHTGDSCFEKDGLYYYCGRMDNQIKVNGFRVEVEDIENNLVKVDNIARAAVVPVSDGEKVQYLAAFVLLEKADGLSSLKRSMLIKERAAEFLPSYMIPRRITAVEAFPLNTNGKVDKKELAKLIK